MTPARNGTTPAGSGKRPGWLRAPLITSHDAEHGGERLKGGRYRSPVVGALFLLGAMSLTWMAVPAALIAAEKLLPWRRCAAVAAALLALAVGVAAAPADVPGHRAGRNVAGAGDEDGALTMGLSALSCGGWHPRAGWKR